MSIRTLLIGIEAENPDVDAVEFAYDAPSLFDYDIVIADVDSIFNVDLQEKLPVDEKLGVNSKTFRWLSRVTEKLRKEATLLTGKGGLLVYILKPVRGVYYEARDGYKSITNYDWIPIENLSWRISYGKGKRKRLSDDLGPFAQYLKLVETYWVAYFEEIERLKIKSRPLVFNDAGKPIALEVSMDKGMIIFLPISEHPNFGDVLLQCAARSIRKKHERPSPDWIKDIKVPDEDSALQSLEVLSERISNLQGIYDTEISKYEEKTGIKKMLYEKDEILEEIVKQAFEELGFDLKKKGDKDWIASSDAGEAILEVTGSDSSIDIGKLRQLLNYLIDDIEETEVEKKAILVGNHYAKDPPELREDAFTEKVAKESAVHSICLLSTVELYNAICAVRLGLTKASVVRKKIMETTGICKPTDHLN